MTIITKAELNPVILISISLFKASRLSVTTAIESPKERTILSRIFICRKKTSVQAKPGRKKTSMNPRIALRTDNCSRKGKANSNKPLILSSRPLMESLSLVSAITRGMTIHYTLFGRGFDNRHYFSIEIDPRKMKYLVGDGWNDLL